MIFGNHEPDIYKEAKKYIGQKVRMIRAGDNEWDNCTIVDLNETLLTIKSEDGYTVFINLYEMPMKTFVLSRDSVE